MTLNSLYITRPDFGQDGLTGNIVSGTALHTHSDQTSDSGPRDTAVSARISWLHGAMTVLDVWEI